MKQRKCDRRSPPRAAIAPMLWSARALILVIHYVCMSLGVDAGACPACIGRGSLRCNARAAGVLSTAPEPPGLPTRGVLGGYGRPWRRE